MFVTHRCTDFGMAEAKPRGDGVVTGWGTINGRMVYVFQPGFHRPWADRVSETHAAKICKIMDMAMQNGAPGHRHQRLGRRPHPGGASAALPPMARCSSATSRPRAWCRRSASSWAPAPAGAVYSPAMTDFIFMVKDSSYMFVTGPDVVKTVTNEHVTAEELGGATTHTRKILRRRWRVRERCRGRAGRGAAADRFPAAVQPREAARRPSTTGPDTGSGKDLRHP